MSAVVQELYSGLPVTLATERTALLDPAIVFGAKPDAPAFVLSCSSLPSEHYRTHGLKICSKDSAERLDCTGKAPSPGLMDLPSQEPVEAGGLVKDDETLNRDVMKLDLNHGCSKEDAGAAKDLGSVVEEGLAQYSLISKEISKEKAPCLIHEGRKFLPRPSSVEIASLQQNPEENQANVQVTTENLSDPMKEAQGMKADGTDGLFSKAGERSVRGSAGVSPESSESSEIDTVMAKVEVSETNTLVSLEPVSTMDNASVNKQLQGEEEEGKGLTACATSSVTRDVLPSPEAGGNQSLSQDVEVNAVLDDYPSPLQDKMNLHDNSGSAPVLESKITIEPLLSNSGSEASGHPLKGSLELGNTLWEENVDVFETVCEMQEEGCVGGEEEDLRSCEKMEVLEGWACEPNAGETLPPIWSSEELPSKSSNEQEVGVQDVDRAYSCVSDGAVEVQQEGAVQCRWKYIEENSHPENNGFVVPAGSFAVAKIVCPEDGISSSSEGHSEDSLRPASSGIGIIQRGKRPSCGRLAIEEEENRSLVMEQENFGCFQSSCSISIDSNPTHHDSLDCSCKLGEVNLLQMQPNSGPRTEILKSASAVQVLATSVGDVNLAAVEGNPQMTQLSDEHLSIQRSERVLSSSKFLDNLPKEEFPAKLEMQHTRFVLHAKKELPLKSQDVCSCAVTSEQSGKSTALLLRDAEQRPADMETVQAKACHVGDQRVNSLCAASETCCTMSGGAPLDDDYDDEDDLHDVLKRRTESKAEGSDGLEASPRSASDREGISPEECGGVKAGGHHPCGNSCEDLDEACSLKAKASESDVVAENRWTGSDNTCVKSEEILDVDGLGCLFPPDSNLEQRLIKASVVADSDGAEAAERVKMYKGSWRNGLSEKPAGDRDLDKASCPFECGEAEEGRHQGHPSSSTPEPPNVKSANIPGHTEQQHNSLLLEDLCVVNPGQPRGAICPTKVRSLPYQNSHLNKLVLLNQKNESLEREASECQLPPLMSSEKQKEGHSTETVTCSAEETEKPVNCSQNELLCPKRVHHMTPTPPLLTEEKGVQGKFQQSTLGYCTSIKVVPEFTGNPRKESVELKNTDPHSECAPELLRLNGFITDQAPQATTDELSPASEAVSRNPSEVLDKKAFLKCNSKPASIPSQMFFQPDPLTSATANGQKVMEGVHSTLLEKKQVPSLASMCLGVQLAQIPGVAWSQKDDPSTSPSPHALSCPLVKEHPGITESMGREVDDHRANPLASGSENEEASCSVKEDTPLDYPPDSQEMSTCTEDTKPGAEVAEDVASITSHSPDPSKKKIKASLEVGQEESSLTTEKMELSPHPLSGTEESSGAVLRGLTILAEGGEIAFPFKIEIHAWPSFTHQPGRISGLGSAKVKDPSTPAVVFRRHLENMSYALQMKYLHLCPTRRSLEISYSIIPCVSSGGCRLEASPKGRSLQAAEGCQKLAGDKKKPLKDHLASLGAVEKARGSEAGDRLMLTQKPLREEAEQTLALPVASCDAVGQEEGAEVKATVKRPLKRRLLNLGPPLGSSSREMVVKSGGPAWRAFAGGSAVEDGKYEDPWCTLRRAKRPKRVKDLIELKCPEAESLSLCFRSQGRQSAASNSPVLLVFCTLPQTAGFSYDRSRSPSIRTHKIRPLLPFRRQPGKACFRVRVPGQFRVARSHLMANSAFLRDPNPKCQLMESVCFAMKPTGSKVGMVRAQMPKQRGSPSSLPDSPWLRNHTKEPALLRKLSVLADKLLAPPRSPQNLTQLLVSTELLPVPENYSQLGSKKLLEVFSCVDMKLNSPWLKGGSCSLKMFSSQSLALYPLELTNLFFLELGNKTSLAFSTPVFPVSFHIKMDSSPTSNLLGLTSLHSAPHSHQPVLGEAQALQPSKWAFSFLLSQNCLGVAPIQKDACIPSVSPAVPPASPTAAKGRGREAAAHWRRAGGCPTLAHPTALALSSLGCYRVWTRKRNLGHRIPTLPKLAVRQFTRGLKGLTCSPVVSADLSSSWPSSLGRVLSIWSRHGPPTCPSEITPLRSNLGKWQPVRVATARLGFFGNSSTMLPQVPDQLVDNPRAASDAWRLEPSFSASLPTSCSVLEPARSPLGLPAPSFQVHPLDRLDVPVPVLPEAGSRLEKADLETRPKKVSQIRIRKTVPKPDPNLTPMGLPRPKRLKKTEFSLEEIYTNKNYKSPPTTRCLETIFEEPKEKNGSLISVSQQKRKRILEFQDFTVPRKRKARSRVKATGGSTRAQKAALEGRELDILLIQKLTDLETFFAKEEEQEQASGS